MSVSTFRRQTAPSINVTTSTSFTAVLAPPDWDHSFHGSVHTATLAVCTVLVIFIVILGTFGNGLVVLSAIQSRRLRSNFDLLAINLATADLLICSCLAPIFLYLLFTNPPSPREFCGGFLFGSTSCGMLSLLSLVAIAAHRESRVRGRLKGALSGTRAACILSSIYVASIGTAVGGTLHVMFWWSESSRTCQSVINSTDITSNNVVLFFISPVIVVSFIIIVVSYVIIARAVRTQTYLRVKALQSLLRPAPLKPTQPAAPSDPTSSDLQQMLAGSKPATKSEPLRHCSCCGCMTALDKENKAVTMCFVVVLIISLCWTPLVISHVVELITGESLILYQVKLCAIALVFLNSALNPYMYSQNSARIKRRYGRVFWDMLHCDFQIPQPRGFTSLMSKKIRSRTLEGHTGPNCSKLKFVPNRKLRIRKQAGGMVVCGREQTLKYSMNIYDTNFLLYSDKQPGNQQANPPQITRQDVNNSRKVHAPNGVIRDVRSLVNKTCCHANSPDDRSLIDS